MNEIELLNRMLEREKQARKTAETLMEQKSRELYEVNQGLRRLAEELTVARNLASQANEAKSSFLASMSHELRTPLNAIIGYSEILAEEAEDSGRQDMIADLKKICSAGKHLLALINDVLDLSKIEAGKMDLYIEGFEVASMIEEVVSTVAPLIEKNANVLELRCAESLGTMRADLTKLRQALFNLLSNASKFTSRGIVRLFGHSAGGRPAERLMCRLGMPLGYATILRHVKRSARSQIDPAVIRVAGVDDWAWRKGTTYGTVIVDLERRQVVDLLPDRSAVSTAKWLKAHPEIEIVSRDRAGLYAAGAASR